MPVEKSYVVFGGDIVDVLVSSATTGGQFSIITELVQPQIGPPPHVHTLEDEFLLPIEGSFEVFDGTAWAPLPSAGQYTARNHVHTFRNAGTKPGKIMAIATGSSFDVFLEKLAPLQLPRDMHNLIDISAQHGITYVMPPPPDHIAVPA